MTSRKVRLRKLAGGLKMRSRDRLIRLRDTKLRHMGVARYRYLIAIPVLLALIVLVGILRAPQTTRTVFRPIEDSFSVPRAGWAVHADTRGQDERLDVSLVYAELTWAELESVQGEFDFESFEKKNDLDKWWAEGKQMIFRFIMDRPGKAGHMDIPEWLYEEMGGEGLAGSFYETSAGAGFAPDYSNVFLREAHRQVILRIAERYDNHPGVAYVEIGSLGRGGEWTVELGEEGVNALPTSTISREYAWHYTSAFADMPMLMRRPYKETQLMEVGLYNPHLGDFEATWEYINWFSDGGYDEQIQTDLLAMPEFYNLSPSGAHIPAEIDLESLLDEQAAELERLISESHLNYVVIDQPTGSLSDQAVGRLKTMERQIGYRIWLRSAEWDSQLRAGMRSKAVLEFRNDGAALLHEQWPVALALFAGDKPVHVQVTDLNASMIVTGSSRMTCWIDIPYETGPGEYTLRLAILNPSDMQPAVRLRQEECNEYTLWTELGEFRVIR